MDVAQLLEQARRCEEEGRLEDALAAWLGLSRLDPESREVYERLFALYVHRREVDAAFCAASVLACLDALEGMPRELYDDYRPRRLSARRPDLRLSADDWALLRHPLEVSARPSSVAPYQEAIDTKTHAWAAALLAVPVKDSPPDAAPSLDGRPDLDDVWHNYALRERLFFAGRAAAARRGSIDLPLTFARAGLLVCGEPLVAYELLVRENADRAALGHLLHFAVSPAHLRLRKKLGIAVGLTADAAEVAHSPSPPRKGRAPTNDAILRALLEPEGPPTTVRALADALDIEIEAGVSGTIVVPARALAGPFFAVRHVEGRVVAFWVRCILTDEMEAVLRAKGFESARFTGGRGDVYRTFGPWVATTQSGYLGWFATLPDWLSVSVDWKERDAMLSALGKAIREAEGVTELQSRVSRLAPMVVVSHVDARGIDVRLVPSIPANVNRAYIWANRSATRDAEGWVLVDDDKPGKWTMLPRLADHPTGGIFDNQRHAAGILDVVASMRITLTAAPPASLHPPSLVAIMDALLLAPTWPRTVRELERALGFSLTEAHFASIADHGSLDIREGLPAPLSGVVFRWLGETRPRSIDALRGRALTGGWSLQITKGRAYFEERLRAAFGAPNELPNRHEFRTPHGRLVLSGPAHEDGGTLALVVQNTLPT